MATRNRSIDLVAGGEHAPPTPTTERRQPGVLTPREVLKRARANVEHIGLCLVKGEISEVRPHRNGHLFFKLLDAGDRKAALPCALWVSDARRLKFVLKDGLAVVVDGKVGLNDFASVQLVVRDVQPEGMGALELAFQQMKDKLAAEGLFAAERKRAPPYLPRAVGVVTSTHGAAIRDVLARLFERFPRLPVLVASTLVQGDAAPAEIAAALQRLDRSARVDVILLVRGGGSREDLFAFNTEPVARAIAGTSVPVIAGVGHESDVTIADLVADVRAATPTHAAELAVPRLADLERRLDEHARRLRGRVAHAITERRVRCAALGSRLDHALARRQRQQVERVRNLDARLRRLSPDKVLRDLRLRLTRLDARLHAGLQARQRLREQRVALLAARLDALSPLTVLARGYAIATRADDGRVIHAAGDAPPRTDIVVRVSDGALRARVLEDQ